MTLIKFTTLTSSRILLPLLFLFSANFLMAGNKSDTLRYFVTQRFVSYNHPEIVMQIARFDVPSRCILKSLQIRLNSNAPSKGALVHLYGQEGGMPVPSLRKDLVSPFFIKKKSTGEEIIDVDLSGQNLEIKGTQFFVGLDNFDSGVSLLSDATEKKPLCSSMEAGQYYFQALIYKDGRIEYGKYSFAIEAVIEYPEIHEPTFISKKFSFDQGKAFKFKGIAAADINKDTYPDLLVQGALYINKSGKDFIRKELPGSVHRKPSPGSFIDIDNDGDLDILLFGTKAELMINTDDEFTAYDLNLPPLYPTSISLGDVNSDGYADIFVGQYSSGNYSELKNVLLLNTGELSFTISEQTSFNTKPAACTGSTLLDFNNDGFLDLFLANAKGANDKLFFNDGAGNFTESADFALQRGHSRGNHWADFNADGDLDLLSPQLFTLNPYTRNEVQGSSIYYRNKSTGNHRDFGKHLLANDLEFEEKQSGGAWADFNNDGLVDCILTTSCDCRYPTIYLQTDKGFIPDPAYNRDIQDLSGLNDILVCDLDNNGGLDIVATKNDTLYTLFQVKSGQPQYNFVGIDLLSASTGNPPTGSSVTLYSGDKVFRQVLSRGHGMNIQEPGQLHFGLEKAERVDSLIVEWSTSNGTREIIRNLKANQLIKIKEGENVPLSRPSYSGIDVFPNPSKSDVLLRFFLEHPAHVSIEIYSMTGQLLEKLVNADEYNTGNHEVQWKARNKAGVRLPSGAYVYRYMAGPLEQRGYIYIVD